MGVFCTVLYLEHPPSLLAELLHVLLSTLLPPLLPEQLPVLLPTLLPELLHPLLPVLLPVLLPELMLPAEGAQGNSVAPWPAVGVGGYPYTVTF